MLKTATETIMAENNINDELIKEMANLGVIFGHKKSKTHPRMRPYIGASRSEVEILDPQATLNGLAKAIAFLKEKTKDGGLIILAGALPAARTAIKEFAEKFNFPYVTTRWLGGTLTNFKVIGQRLAYYQDLKAKKESGELGKYTKKEQLKFNEQIKKLAEVFEGLVNLKRLPDAVFVVDIKEHDTAVREARRLKIPIVAILDNDDDPELVDYPIFASDHAKSGIEWVMAKIKEGLEK